MLENPFGIGTFTFRDSYHHEEVHNVYLSQFLNAGWLGGMLYIVSVVATLRGRLPRRLPQRRAAGAVPHRHDRLRRRRPSRAWSSTPTTGAHFFIIMGCIWGLADAVPPRPDPSRRRGDWTPLASSAPEPVLEAAP